MSSDCNTNSVANLSNSPYDVSMTHTQGTSPYAGRAIPEWTSVEEFTDYCREFYSVERPGAIYPFAYEMEIVTAVNAHLTDPNPLFPFDGDSADREAVRDRILAERRLLGFEECDFDKAVERGRLGIM